MSILSRRKPEPDLESVKGGWRAKVAPTVTTGARGAVEWAAPRYERGLAVAAPKVEAAVASMTPAVEAAKVKIDDLMPRLVEAVTAAAAAGAAASVTASEYKARSGDAVAVLKGEAVAKRPSKRLRRVITLVPIAAGAGAAGFAAFKSRAPKEDPWAAPTGTYPAYTPPAPAAEPTSSFSTNVSSSEPSVSVLGTGSAADALDGDSTAAVSGLSSDSIDVTETSTSPEPYDPTSPSDRI